MVTVIAFASNTAKGHHITGIWVPIFFVIFFALLAIAAFKFIKQRRNR